MMIYLVVFITQLLYIIIKFVGIRHIVADNVINRLVVTVAASGIWLITTSIGVNEMIDGNYIVIVPYLSASVVGVLVENKIRKRF